MIAEDDCGIIVFLLRFRNIRSTCEAPLQKKGTMPPIRGTVPVRGPD
jgi:hypothetical protein